MDVNDYGFCPLHRPSPCTPNDCAWGSSDRNGHPFCAVQMIGNAAYEYVDNQYSDKALEASLDRIAKALEAGINVYEGD